MGQSRGWRRCGVDEIMATAQISLTESQTNALHRLSVQTGKSEDELLLEAIDKLINDSVPPEIGRRRRLEAAGIWKDRTDLPDFRELRKEWDRFDPSE